MSAPVVDTLLRAQERLLLTGTNPTYARNAMVPTMLLAHARLTGNVLVDWGKRRAFINVRSGALEHAAASLPSAVQQPQTINLYGADYALYRADDDRLAQLTDMQRLLADQLPVYRERLSRQWHAAVRHTQQVFVDKEKALISKIKLNLDGNHLFTPVNNAFPEKYGHGKIYTVMRQHDAVVERLLLRVIEMNGELVPIRSAKKDPCSYEIYHLETSGKRGTPVQWDGARWTFCRSNTPQLSRSLRQEIVNQLQLRTGEETISAEALLAPDHNGIRWHQEHDNHGYIKVHDRLVRIARDGHERAAFIIPHLHGRIEALYERGMLHLKSAAQKEHFPLQNNKKVLRWRMPSSPQGAPDAPLRAPVTRGIVALGARIKDTEHGPVFDDLDHAGLVIKRFDTVLSLKPTEVGSSSTQQRHLLRSERVMLACKEAALFNQFYGRGSAEVVADDTQVYLKMQKIPGKPLAELPPGSLPADAAQRLRDMLTRLSNSGVWRGDIQEKGIQYCVRQGLFYPSDFSRSISSYLDGMPSLSRATGLHDKLTWQSTFALVEARIGKAEPRLPC